MKPKSWLALRRIEKGFSQTEFAEKLGVCMNTVCSWENGKTNPGAWVIQDVADLLGVSLEVLRYHLPNGGRPRYNGRKKANVEW